MIRTHTCGELTAANVGQEVVLCGWVHTIREHRNTTFVELRDRYGIVQVVVNSDDGALRRVTKEAVVKVQGGVQSRPEGTANTKLSTGEVEVSCTQLELLGPCQPLPFEVRDETNAGDELRMEFRYLDFRRPHMLRNLVMRSDIVKVLRQSLESDGFIEIETPMFVKSTPEGSRDFIVPSRRYEGKFYALPQSPQLYKQILMVGGVDRYYSIPRCFRDEDARRGRQLIHTQIDLEMSFAEEADVYGVVEHFLRDTFGKVLGIDLPVPFPRLSYDDVIARFGIDKPDLRFGMEIQDVSEPVSRAQNQVLRRVLDEGGHVRALVAPNAASFSLRQLDELEEFVKRYGAGGLAWIKLQDGTIKANLGKATSDEALSAIAAGAGAGPGDLVLIVGGRPGIVARSLGELRNQLARQLGLIPANVYKPLWVTEFPMFEWDEEGKRWTAMHHMFTQPKTEHLEFLTTSPGDVRARLYDVVLNGVELGSGSIRITDPELQQRIMNFVGYPREKAEDNFGFFLRAYTYGAPQHAGIALGLDNLVMTMLGLTNLQDVIAFPNNSSGVFPLDGSPSYVDDAQLAECHVRVVK